MVQSYLNGKPLSDLHPSLNNKSKINLMETNWFKKTGIIYFPVSVIGVIMYLLTICFCITVFLAVDRHSHSSTDTLYGIFPYFVSAFTILFWVASNTSENIAEK